MSEHRIINADCLHFLRVCGEKIDCIFADPPDNIGLGYSGYSDRCSAGDYMNLLHEWTTAFVHAAPIVWISFNSKWWARMGEVASYLRSVYDNLEDKLCVQTFTFGQHRQHDLGNCFRPLLRLRRIGTPLYPDQIRVPSKRLERGDKRADPRGRVPGDVFDFPRVVGNSRQRRKWCPTQLHEGLVERCVKLSTKPGDLVYDPFAGSGTTLRVCRRNGRRCIVTDVSTWNCSHISDDEGIPYELLASNKAA